MRKLFLLRNCLMPGLLLAAVFTLFEIGQVEAQNPAPKGPKANPFSQLGFDAGEPTVTPTAEEKDVQQEEEEEEYEEEIESLGANEEDLEEEDELEDVPGKVEVINGANMLRQIDDSRIAPNKAKPTTRQPAPKTGTNLKTDPARSQLSEF